MKCNLRAGRNILFISFLFSIKIFCQRNKVQEKDTVLFGKVNKIRQSNYTAKEIDGRIVQGKIINSDNYLKVFDAKKRLIEWWRYNTDDSCQGQKSIYKYDNKGKKIEIDWVNSDSNVFSMQTIKYDSNGRKIELLGENLNQKGKRFGGKHTYKYDERGNKIEECMYPASGKLNQRYAYLYNDKGKFIEVFLYKGDGKLLSKETLNYNEKGNLVEDILNHRISASQLKDTYAYDVKGNEIEWNRYRKNDSIGSKTTYTYDDRNNLIEENMYKSDGKKTNTEAYLYYYDDQGNWIERVTSRNGNIFSVTIRQIIYYE